MTETLEPWLAEAWSHNARQSWFGHDGCALNLREWGRVGNRAVILVHGGGANSHWWDHIAPWLAVGRRVIAMDLSGHGDSDWREDGYSLGRWADEVSAVATAVATPHALPIIVGHSMGGLVTLTAAMMQPVPFAGAIVLDVAARRIGPEEQARRDRRAGRANRIFDSEEAAIAGFRTLPDAGENQIAAIVRHVAVASIRNDTGGWVLKTDRRIFLRDALPLDTLRSVEIAICVVAAGNGLLRPARAAEMAQRLGPLATVASVPLAGHHLMLDQPIALTNCLQREIDLIGSGIALTVPPCPRP